RALGGGRHRSHRRRRRRAPRREPDRASGRDSGRGRDRPPRASWRRREPRRRVPRADGRRPLIRLVGAELLKVRTTWLLLWLGLLVLGLEVLVIALHVSQNSLSELAQPRNQRDVVSIAAVSALISLILGIVASAGEFANGTIGHTFLVAPVRERVALAKLAAAALAGAALALAACVFAWA